MEILEIQQHTDAREIVTPQFTPEVLIFETSEGVDAYAALRVANQIQNKPNSVLTLPTGNTPSGMYKHLVSLEKSGNIDMQHITIFNLDEYYPIDPSDSHSYSSYMRRHLLESVPVKNWHIPNGQADNPQDESETYKALLDSQQPVDLAVLGIGPGTTCHIGFNEQGSTITSSVRYVPLDPQTRETNSQLFDNPNEIPEGTITQGVADILQAEKIIVIAKGAGKAWGINRTLKGPISSDAPASFLRLHPHVTFILDKEAAAYL